MFNEARFAELATLGLPSRIRQSNHSRSRRDVLRGLHYQLVRPQGKLISVVRGEVYDVAVDIRPDSPTFRRWMGVHLTEDAPRAVWIPPGFAHGFCVLSDVADVVYGCTEIYDASDDRGIRWDDPTVGIEWPVSAPLLSPRDERLPRLAEALDLLPRCASGRP
jgi:dTDP-4-dehydrorhamnose 3,5-epimerase